MSSFQTKTAEISHRRNYRLYGIWKIIIKVVEEAHNFFYQDRVMNLLKVLWVVPSLTSEFALYISKNKENMSKFIQNELLYTYLSIQNIKATIYR